MLPLPIIPRAARLIYEYLLAPASSDGNSLPRQVPKLPINTLAILRTCKHISAESLRDILRRERTHYNSSALGTTQWPTDDVSNNATCHVGPL